MNIRIRKIIAGALVFALGPVVANAQPVEWTVASGGNGNFYEAVSALDISWDDADDAAQLRTHDGTASGVPGHLATITSADENDFVDGRRVAEGLAQVWIGGFQLDGAGEPGDGWGWVNGEGLIPGTNPGPPFANWASGEPNDAGGPNQEQFLTIGLTAGGGWNDGINVSTVVGFIVEYDVASRFVPPGPGGILSTGAFTGVSGKFQNVITGGNVSINCCVVHDRREGTGHTKRFGDFDPVNLDLGFEIDEEASCAALRVYGGEFGSNKAVLRPWQRGIPRPEGNVLGGPNDIGVCLIQSEAIMTGVIVTEEETDNVLGFSVDCSAEDIIDRPYTGGVAILPPELDSPNVVRITGECNGSRSAKRGSDNLIVLNLRHFFLHNGTKPYLSRLGGTLQDAIEFHSRPETFDPPDGPGCLDPDESFAENLLDLLEIAQQNFGKNGIGETAVTALENATLLALLADTGSEMPPGNDPYAACTDNQLGLFVGRFIALTHATCSEKVQNDDGEIAKAPTACAIDTRILDAIFPPAL